MQTEEDIPEDIQLYDDDSPELFEFLRRMEPLVSKELRKNVQSHAFDGNFHILIFSHLVYSLVNAIYDWTVLAGSEALIPITL